MVAVAVAVRAELSMVLSSWLSGDLWKRDLTLCLCVGMPCTGVQKGQETLTGGSLEATSMP